MVAVARFARHFGPVVDALYPPRCPSCGVAIASQAGLCSDCWSSLEVPTQAENEVGAVPIYAATYYNETSRKLVLAFKHGRRIALAPLLARLIAPKLEQVDAEWLVVPVPLYHCFGMVMANLGCLTHGSTLIYPGDAFDPLTTLRAVAEERATAL